MLCSVCFKHCMALCGRHRVTGFISGESLGWFEAHPLGQADQSPRTGSPYHKWKMSAHGFERSTVHTADGSEAAFEDITQAYKWIEADDVGRIGHEVGQRVDVVEVQASVALTLQELDTTEVEASGCADTQHSVLDPSRWIDR